MADSAGGSNKARRQYATPRPSSSKGTPTFNDVEPGAALGQFAFAPATQTTTVTTTTVTTTKFPPFLMRPPKRKRELDHKAYPLAAAATPAELKEISFWVDGLMATFKEAEDPDLTIQEVSKSFRSNLLYTDRNVLQTLKTLGSVEKAKGTVRQVQTSEPSRQSATRNFPRGYDQDALRSRPRPVSPESITDDENESGDAVHGSTEEGLEPLSIVRNNSQTIDRRHPSMRRISERGPVTPSSLNKQTRQLRRSTLEHIQLDGRRSEPEEPSCSTNAQRQAEAPPTRQAPQSARQLAELVVEQTISTPIQRRSDVLPAVNNVYVTMDHVVPTPPLETDDQHRESRPPSRRHVPSIPSRLSLTDTPVAQDGSLPSPSLSPITAAANAQHTGYFADIDSTSDFASPREHDIDQSAASFVQTPSSSRLGTPTTEDRGIDQQAPFHGSSNDFSAMFDYFEGIPDELKSYVMHQLLRRCPKTTLQVVADAVNPALKCDFLTALPLELALHVLKFLNVRSLCKASQVSRKWRQLINTDEGAWKELLDADGFTLPDGELHRAITEGWGWQDPAGVDGYEHSLAPHSSQQSDTDGSVTSPYQGTRRSEQYSNLRRSKRKAATTLSARSAKSRRKGPYQLSPSEFPFIDFMAQMSTSEGPYNAANAAALAVPNADVGLPSLKGLHLYKSLYRRHYLIQRNWMFEDTKPHHLAFGAHDRHVVTCLQFDTDKILTGSDDNNINVYDTKTGALKAKLEGHEGGVWALQYNGNTLVSGSTDRSVRVWDIERGRETQVFRGHTSTVRCLQIVSPVKTGETADGKAVMMPKYPLIITGSRDSTLRVWKLPMPEDPPYHQPESSTDDEDCPYFIRMLTGHTHSVRAIAAHADTLVSGSYDSSVRVWRISTGETVHRLQGHSAKVYSVVLDHKRNRCISGSMDNMVKIWSLDTGSLINTLDGHTSLVGLLDLNRDRLVSAAADSTLRIWDPETGQCKATLSAHTGAITCFQHDAQKVISGSDRTLKMWNIKTGECIKDLLSDLSGVWQVKFNERRCVAAVQRDNMTYIEVSGLFIVTRKSNK